MLTPRRLSAAAILTAAASLTLAAGSAAARTTLRSHVQSDSDHAVFVQTDNIAGNAIAVYDRDPGGTLTAAGTYPTGGNGGILAQSQADHLASQNSLVYDRAAGELFAVNAGSDTVSVFDVQGDHLALRQVIGSGGTFPASIAVHGDLVYVLNALGRGTIQGYRLAGDGRLVPLRGSSRSLGLDPSATPQFVSTPGDIAFTPDGGDLLVTTKANTNAIDVFSIDPSGRPAATPVVNSEPGTVPFALAFEGGNQVDVGEAMANAVASFELQPDGTLQQVDSLGTGGAATCWLVADGPVLFAGNAGSATESSVLDSAGSLSLAATTSTDPGTVDAATSPRGHYLYVQTGAKGIVDEFGVGTAGALTALGSVTVPNGAGGEGIATS